MMANLATAFGPSTTRTHALSTVLTPETERQVPAHTPINRLGEPEDSAGAVLYFAAPISGWVSGQMLSVNGGGVQTLEEQLECGLLAPSSPRSLYSRGRGVSDSGRGTV